MTTLERLQNILMKAYKLDRAALGESATLESLGVDSLGMLELFFEVEDEFDIKVPNEPLMLKTVGEVSLYIDELVSAQHTKTALAE